MTRNEKVLAAARELAQREGAELIPEREIPGEIDRLLPAPMRMDWDEVAVAVAEFERVLLEEGRI